MISAGAGNALSGKFQDIKSDARVAIGKNSYLLQGILVNGDVQLTQTALLVGESALEYGQNVGFAEALQGEDARTGQEGRVDFKAGGLRGGADQCYGTALDTWEDGILLRFVEAVNLVDKEDGVLFAELAQLLCFINHAAQVRDPC